MWRVLESLIWPLLHAMTQDILLCQYVQPGDWTLEVVLGDPTPVSPLSSPLYVGKLLRIS